ncbi:hypothetical protein Goklo_000104 [Gossypium klotzschianum]|uniref:Uncharacterized protein n=2 Tax=Gossypium TaxID=3633 RepID=A0A7J8WE98_9ROSI|nr:hypothetical protein [Gossypium klotzschianum]
MKFNSLMKQTGLQSSYIGGEKKTPNSINHAEEGYIEMGASLENLSLKKEGEIMGSVQTGKTTIKAESYVRKRKFLDADLTSFFQENNRDGIKRLKQNTQVDSDTGPSEMMTDNVEQSEVQDLMRSAAANRQADRTQ